MSSSGRKLPCSLLAIASILPRALNSVASCTPTCSRKRLSWVKWSLDRVVRQRQRHHLALFHQVLQQVVEHALAQAQAAFQRIVDAHVKPGFDALAEELHRHAIHQRARQHRHESKHPQHAQRQLGAEHARLELLPQHP